MFCCRAVCGSGYHSGSGPVSDEKEVDTRSDWMTFSCAAYWATYRADDGDDLRMSSGVSLERWLRAEGAGGR